MTRRIKEAAIVVLLAIGTLALLFAPMRAGAQSTGRVIVMRSGAQAWATNVTVKVDGQKLPQKLGRGRYMILDLPAGQHMIGWEKDILNVQVRPGETSYFDMRLQAGLIHAHWYLTPLDQQSGEMMLGNVKSIK